MPSQHQAVLLCVLTVWVSLTVWVHRQRPAEAEHATMQYVKLLAAAQVLVRHIIGQVESAKLLGLQCYGLYVVAVA